MWDGTYTLDDLLDIREMIAVDYENKLRMGGNDEQSC